MKAITQAFIENGDYCYPVSELIQMVVPEFAADSSLTGKTVVSTATIELIARLPVDVVDALPTPELRAAAVLAEADRMMAEELPKHVLPKATPPAPTSASLDLPADGEIDPKTIRVATTAVVEYRKSAAARDHDRHQVGEARMATPGPMLSL